MLTILASFAQEESRSVSENCKWRIHHNYEEGIANGFQIYGYNIKNRQITINEEQAAVVRLIFEMYLSGIGTITIAKQLNGRGIPAPGGKTWNKASIVEMLKNEKYAGDILLPKYYSENHISKRTLVNNGVLKKYLVTDNHEPIIDRDTFERVQKIIADKAERNPRVAPYDYQFKNMVFCGCCGAKYYRKKVHTGTPSEHFVWKCNSYAARQRRTADAHGICRGTLRKSGSGSRNTANAMLMLNVRLPRSSRNIRSQNPSMICMFSIRK